MLTASWHGFRGAFRPPRFNSGISRAMLAARCCRRIRVRSGRERNVPLGGNVAPVLGNFPPCLFGVQVAGLGAALLLKRTSNYQIINPLALYTCHACQRRCASSPIRAGHAHGASKNQGARSLVITAFKPSHPAIALNRCSRSFEGWKGLRRGLNNAKL